MGTFRDQAAAASLVFRSVFPTGEMVGEDLDVSSVRLVGKNSRASSQQSMTAVDAAGGTGGDEMGKKRGLSLSVLKALKPAGTFQAPVT